MTELLSFFGDTESQMESLRVDNNLICTELGCGSTLSEVCSFPPTAATEGCC